MNRGLLLAFCVAGALSSAPALANRLEFEATHAGARVAGAEVCFQPAAAIDETYQRWLWTNELRCLPADQVLDFPAGRWNYFARHESGLISPAPQMIVFDRAVPESGYRRLHMLLERAATLDAGAIRLGDGERLFLFLTNRTSPFGSSIHPLPAGATRQLIPAGVDVIPIVVRNQRPARLLEPVNAKAGEVVTARERRRAEGTVDLVAWVQLDVPAITKLDDPLKLAPFDVRLRIGRRVITQQFPMKNGALSHLSLATFVDVPKGKAKLELYGGDWTPDRREVTLEGDLVVVEQPLTSSPAARIGAAWALPRGSVADRDRPCDAKAAAAAPEVLVRLQRCAQPDRCQLLSLERTAAAETGQVRFDGLAPGRYTVDAIVAGLRVPAMTVDVAAGEERAVDVSPSPVTVRGHVTRDGAAVSALLRFGRAAARTDPDTGEYTLLLDQPSRAESVVHIEPCDGSPGTLEIVPIALENGTVFDLDLSDRDTRVEVADATTGRPVAGAAVTFAARGSDGEVRYATRGMQTDDQGRATVEATSGRELELCASAAGYAEKCIAVPPAERARPARVELRRNGGRRGRVLSDAPIAGGILYFTAGDGELLETVAIDMDGAFHCVCEPRRAAYIVLVSDLGPMQILPPPADEGDELRLAIARPASVRTVHVSLAPSAASRGGRLSLAADGRPIPLLALTHHQIKRRLPIVVLRGQHVPLPDIAAVTIELLLIPLYEDLPPALMSRDIAILREWQPVLPRKIAAASGVVMFE